MKWFVLLLMPGMAFSQSSVTPIVKADDNVKVPARSRCYDLKDQVLLDNALDTGTECLSNLELCRKWRDKYKARVHLLSQPKKPLESKSWLDNRVVKFGLGFVVLGVGIGIGSTL